MTNDMLALAQSRLLVPTGLTDSDLERVLNSLLGHHIDSADLYFQSIKHESFGLEDGIVKEGSFDIGHGVGVRAISGEKTGFAYSDEIILPALEQAATAARSIAKLGKAQSLCAWERKKPLTPLYTTQDPLASLKTEEKVALLRQIDAHARAQDPRVVQVMINLTGSFDTILVMVSDGTLKADIRPLVRLSINVIVEQNGRRESGSMGGGARATYDFFTQENRALQYAEEAVRQALVNLEAIDTPAGAMTVVLGPGWPGVLLHEAVGHGLREI